MPRMFISVEDKEESKTYFLEWSTISDLPNSKVVEEKDFPDLYQRLGYYDSQFAGDLERLNETGVSSPHYTKEDLLECSDDIETEEQLLEFCRTFLN